MSSESAVQNIQKKLASLRRNIRFCLLLEGVSHLLLAAFAFVFLSFFIDFFGHMDLAQRALMLILGITALTVVALRRIVHPLMNTVSDDGLCLEIEQRHKELHDGLITAIQLARIDDTRSYFSPAMVNNAIRSGTTAAEQVNFEDILDRERRNRHLFLGIGIIATFILVFLLSPSNTSLWFQRNIFLQPAQWPRETTLFVMGSKNGKLAVPEGADLNLRVKADPDGVIPAEVELHTRPAARRHVRTSPMSRVSNNSFRLTFESVQKPFELRVRGNDHKTQWYKVRLLKRPRLERLQLTVLPPEYVGQEEIALPPGQSAYRILTGSALKMEAFSQKQLQQAKLMRGEKTIADLTLEGKKHFTITIPGKNLKGGRYSIDLTDIFDIGIDRPMQFVLRIRPDRKPDVRAKLEGIGNMILPRATLPLNARFKDDYAITNAWLLCQANTGDKQHKEKRLKLGGLAEKIAQDKPEIRHECRVDISQMNLEPENHLLLRVQATDNDTISGPKIGDSRVLSLRVVTPEALRAEILRREQDLHQQFKRILNDQKDLYETCRILQANISKGQKIGGDESNSMARLERGQRKMARRNIDIAGQFRGLVAQIRNNHLEKKEGPLQTRLTKEIIIPTTSLAQKWAPQAAHQFHQARENVGDAESCLEMLQKSKRTQREIIARMLQIQKSMAKYETVHEAINILKKILHKQKELKKETEKERKEREKSVFE